MSQAFFYISNGNANILLHLHGIVVQCYVSTIQVGFW